jgi:hypothetical protein
MEFHFGSRPMLDFRQRFAPGLAPRKANCQVIVFIDKYQTLTEKFVASRQPTATSASKEGGT